MRNTVVKPKKKRADRKVVTDEMMRTAMADRNNKNIIRKVLLLYHGLMTPSELETCGMHALWKTLQYHKPEFGKKFTSNLHTFVEWECKRELRRLNNEKRRKVPLSEVGDLPAPENENLAPDHKDKMGQLWGWINSYSFSEIQRTMIVEYFFEQRTYEEIGKRHGLSRESVRHKLDHAINRLRQLTQDEDSAVYSPEE